MSNIETKNIYETINDENVTLEESDVSSLAEGDFGDNEFDVNDYVQPSLAKIFTGADGETEYPCLGAENVENKPNKGFGRFQKGGEKVTIATSYREERKRIQAEKNLVVPNEFISKRTAAFNLLQDKTLLANRLAKTKACRNVLPKEDDPNHSFGVCTRVHCTFAHSLDELQPAVCAFDSLCNRFFGKYDRKTKKTDRSQRCTYFHPSMETKEDFYSRTKTVIPSLPQTSENSYKPTPKDIVVQQQTGQAPQSIPPHMTPVVMLVPTAVLQQLNIT